MKKFILYPILILLGLILTSVLAILMVLFISPTTIINPRTINLVLEKTQVLKSWSWKEAQINHHWLSWKERRVDGYFKDLCFEYQSESMEIKNCFSEFNWDFNLLFNRESGLHAHTLSPLKIYSPKTKVVLHEVKQETDVKSGPPDIWRFWKILWSDMVPDLDVHFKDIEIHSKSKTTALNFKLTKDPKKLKAESFGFTLTANAKSFELQAPATYPLPVKNPTFGAFRLVNFKLKGQVSEDGIPLVATGAVGPVAFTIKSNLDLPLKHQFDSPAFKKQMMLVTTADLSIINVQQSLARHGPATYKTFPAPLNVMNGDIKTLITSRPDKDKNSVLFSAATKIDLEGENQVFQMDLLVEAPVDASTLAAGSVLVGIDFRNISILLPRISKKSLPPQFKPDGRIKNAPFSASFPAEKEGKGTDLTLQLQALNERALHLKTNLLDEVLRLNFDLLIAKGEMQSGYVQVLPLKTTVFKRPIRIEYLKITFNHPLEPVIESTIKFPLPEYKITLKLAGPLSRPRHFFTSVPPLPQSDIHAVLLFGRPLNELDPDDKGAAQQTNKILSQGILSLSVLYFLAGSPVEYVGYDPNSRNATAQIGLGRKNSLRVGGSGSGVNSTAVRRSLGKGWYLDTSVQNSSTPAGGDEKNYGVMLERIIAY